MKKLENEKTKTTMLYQLSALVASNVIIEAQCSVEVFNEKTVSFSTMALNGFYIIVNYKA